MKVEPLGILALVLAVLCVLLVPYFIGTRKRKVIALGRDTYIRFYPNPGIGLRASKRVYALSAKRGFEVMEKVEGGAWVLKRSKFKRR